MRILGFIGSMTAAGAERVMSLLVNTLADEGDEVVLLLQNNIIEYDLDKRIKVIIVDNNGAKNPLSSFLNIFKGTRKVFKDEKPDVIISFMSVPSMYACLCSIGLHIPVVISERNTPSHEVKSKVHSIVRNISYRRAKGAIFQTEEARDYFPKIVRKHSIVISNPVSDNLPFVDRDNVQLEIVTLGRLEKQKNHKLLIDAFHDFYKTHPDYRLAIYGKGKLEQDLRQQIKDSNLDNSVFLMGSQQNIHQKILHSAMFVLSSDYEGISNALMECMAMGLPCISTDCPCGGSRSLIANGVNGLLVPVGDRKALADAMAKLADNPGFRKLIGENAISVRDNYSRKKIIGMYINFIRSCVRQ